MVELEPDFETMTEGQQCDYMGGFNHPFLCPECGYSVIADTDMHNDGFEDDLIFEVVHNLEEKEAIELKKSHKNAKENEIRGNFNEYLARKYYENKGFTCIKLVQYISSKHTLNEKEIVESCLDYQHQEPWRIIKEYVTESGSVAGLPDFLVMNNGSFFFLECKSKLDGLKEKQIECICMLLGCGIKVKVFCTKIDLPSVNYSETEIYDFDLDLAES